MSAMNATTHHRFADRVVLITGASAGIGLATARVFVTQGASVMLAARNPQRLQQAAADLQRDFPDHVAHFPCDVTDRTQVNQLITKTVERFGRLDILINNAGTGLIAPFEMVRPEDAQSLFTTNFFGPFHCIQAALPVFRLQQSGHIVNVSSLAGLRGIPNSSVYAASKAALIALSDALRIELKPCRIHVSIVCPGRIRLADTEFFNTAKKYGPVELYKAPETTANAVAQAILSAVVSRRRLVVLPFHSRMTYWLNRFTPALLDRILYKKMPCTHSATP